MSKNLTEYVTLGRSGLRVSPVCLGTMTFGNDWGWGSEEEVARAVFDHYLDGGGNFIDTADAYTEGKSEELLGKFIKDRGLRDRVVLATKFTFNRELGNPNAGGNGRKNIYRAIEGSLKRLQTDYIDLYWLHGCMPGTLSHRSRKLSPPLTILSVPATFAITVFPILRRGMSRARRHWRRRKARSA